MQQCKLTSLIENRLFVRLSVCINGAVFCKRVYLACHFVAAYNSTGISLVRAVEAAVEAALGAIRMRMVVVNCATC